MAKMSLGGYTFERNPTKMPLITKNRRGNFVETFGGGDFFSWGAKLAGKAIQMVWDFMPASQFDQLVTLLNNDAQVVLNPQTGSTYNVEILSLNGEYFVSLAAATGTRKNVRMELLIISEV